MFLKSDRRESIKLRVSIVVPLLNEIATLPDLFDHWVGVSQRLPKQHLEMIIVDGGSTDGSWSWLQQHWHQPTQGRQLLQSAAGRAKQMNAGAEQASGDVLLFLHADTRLPETVVDELMVARQLNRPWGRFNLQFVESDWRVQLIARCINVRSRLTGIATGDQAIFVDRQLFDKLGGYADIELMEDIQFSQTLKQVTSPYCSKQYVQTSARRWLQNGVCKTVVLMWCLRLGFYFGVAPAQLAKYYYHVR